MGKVLLAARESTIIKSQVTSRIVGGTATLSAERSMLVVRTYCRQSAIRTRPCPCRCGHMSLVIAFIEDPDVIKKILKHLGPVGCKVKAAPDSQRPTH